MKILILEDEATIAQRLERLIKEILGNKLSDLKIMTSMEQAFLYLSENSIDVLLLDLNLNSKNGYRLLEKAIAGAFQTIVVSAYKDKASEAFEYGVLDFVPKPFSKERLEKAFSRLFHFSSETAVQLKYLAVKKQNRIHLIPIDQIKYIRASGVYSELFLRNGVKELHEKNLGNLSLLLHPAFERIHKSYLVKIEEIKNVRVHSGSKYELELKSGEILPIGRTKYSSLKKRWL